MNNTVVSTVIFSLFILQMRKNFEGLRQAQKDETHVQNSSTENFVSSLPAKEKWEKCHREATMELLKVKDRAIELERNVRFVF